MRVLPSVFILLSACQRAPSEQKAVARDLSRALAPPLVEPTDTVAQRKQTELEKCKYVYHDEQGLRECLVLKNGWAPQDAAREIAIYKAEIARAVDSLRRIRDSLEQVAARSRLAVLRRQMVPESIAAVPESARVAKARWDSAVAADAESPRRRR